MKRIPVILLILLSLPIIWNGMSLLHYAVEHTHTFCQSETEHSHSHPENCSFIFKLVDSENQSQVPATKIKFQVLKTYITSNLELCPLLCLPLHQQANFQELVIPDYLFSKDIFTPPILS